MPAAASAVAAEQERQRQLFAERRAEERRHQAVAAATTSENTETPKFKLLKQRAAYNFASKLVGQGLLSETIIAPVVAVVLDNARFLAVHVFNRGKPLRVPWFPIPGVELPPLSSAEILLLVFTDIIVLPLFFILNPFVLVPLIIVVIFA